MSEILGTLFKYLMMLLGVAAVVFILYEVLGSNKTSNAVSQTTQMVSSIQALYAGQNNFSSLNNVISSNPATVVPSAMLGGGNPITDPWGGAVTVQTDANPSMFDVILRQVPNKACSSLAASMGSFESLTINGTSLTPPVDAGAADAACNATTNSLTFVYGG
jgi:hypothetical protein